MSTDVVRIIEVKRNNSKGHIYNKKELKELNPNPGEIYFFHYDDEGFKVWTGNSWETTHPEYRWERVKWKENENFIINGGWKIKTHILSNWGGDYEVLRDRGIPEDSSEEVKKELTESGGYKHTWILLSELIEARDKELGLFKEKVQRISDTTAISRRLDRLEELILKGKTKIKIKDQEYEETLDYLFDEEIWNIISIDNEISNISLLVDLFSGYAKKEDIRINYYLE